MNIPIKSKNEVFNPPVGYVFPFIDSEDMQLKAKLSDGIVINYTSVNEEMKVISLADYTAFEVMPNKSDISAGSVDDVTGLVYTVNVPACTVHKFTLRSSQEPDNCDVVIDWGDGKTESIKDGKYVGHTEGKSYELSHDYATSFEGDKKRFVIKIYGKDYYTFRHNSYSENNLISRIFDKDLPIALHVGNFASMAIYAKRLLKVHFPHSTAPYSLVSNWSYTFSKCVNLLEVTGFEDTFVRPDACLDGLMQESPNLKYTDFVIPYGCGILKGIFNNCTNLECDINKIIPAKGFSSSNIHIRNLFNGNKKLYGTVPADRLWNDKNIKWKMDASNTKPFLNCSDEIKAQVPESWGGTASDDIIEKSLEERIVELEKKVSDLGSNN